jgi:thiol-disulfide isomerase/thioredoxin
VSRATSQCDACASSAPDGEVGFAVGFAVGGTVGYSDRMKRACVELFRADRVVSLGLAWLGLVACGSGGSSAPAAPATPVPAPPAVAAAEAPPATPAQAPAAEPVKLGPIHRLTVADLDGNSVPLSKFAGRPMIIEIWATWCGPCRVNRSTIHKLKPEFPERLLVIGVSYDGSGGRPDAGVGALVRRFLESNPANEHEFLATEEFRDFINQRSLSNSIPKTLYVNGKGQVVDLSEGVQGGQWVRGMAKNLK